MGTRELCPGETNIMKKYVKPSIKSLGVLRAVTKYSLCCFPPVIG